MKKTIITSALALMLCIVGQAADGFTIFLAGDSSASDKSIENGRTERGWGMALCGYFDDSVTVDNRAINGRSSKSFIDEGSWDRILNDMKAGDYVFIQFGHNDEKLHDPARGCPAKGLYKDNLRKMVGDVRDKGGNPILLTSICRRAFTDGVLQETHFAKGDTALYHVAVREVAAELGVPMLDAQARTKEWLEALGDEASKCYFMNFPAGKYAFAPKGMSDNSHLCIAGARAVCELVCEEIKEKVPELAKHLVHYDIVISNEGRGDCFTLQEALYLLPEDTGKSVTIRIMPGTSGKD